MTSGTVTGQGTDHLVISGTVAEINSYFDDGLVDGLIGALSLLIASLGIGSGNPDIIKEANDIAKYTVEAEKRRREITAALKASKIADIIDDVEVVLPNGQLLPIEAVGEFTLSRSIQAGSDFNVQIRTQFATGSTLAVLVTGLAAGFGADRVFIAAGNGKLMVNGVATAIDVGGQLSLASGGITRSSDTVYDLFWNTGQKVSVVQTPHNLQLGLSYGVGDTPGTIVGLVGPGRTAATLLAHPDGSAPSGTASQADLAAFVDSLRVTDVTSLLPYAPGQSTVTFTDRAAPSGQLDLTALPATVLAAPQAAVATAGITDPGLVAIAELNYITSGGDMNVVLAEAAPFAGRTTTPAPVTPGPAALAAGILNEASQITTASTGPTAVRFRVYLTGTVPTDTVFDWAIVAPEVLDLTATAFGGTLPTGTVTILAGQSSAEFTVTVAEGGLGAGTSATLMVQATPRGSIGTLNTSAQSLIVVPKPESPPLITVRNLSQNDMLTQLGNTYNLDLGAIPFSSADSSINLAIGNTAGVGADQLGGTFTTTHVTGFGVSGDNLVAPILPGSSYDGLRIDVKPLKFGPNSETIVFKPTDTNGTGFSAPLAPITINVAYTLEAPTMAYSHAWGDVHIITYNNLNYNFQGVGEFVLAHSTYPGDSFDIQMRLSPFRGSSTVSTISGVGLQIGADRVTLGLGRAATVWLNGVPTTLSTSNTLLSLAGGTVSELSTAAYKIT